jgi:hypothetical protein
MVKKHSQVVLRAICPDQATPELMELSPRLGSLLRYRQAADAMVQFPRVSQAESFVTLRRRTLTPGKRLDEKAREPEWFDPLQDCGHSQTGPDPPSGHFSASCHGLRNKVTAPVRPLYSSALVNSRFLCRYPVSLG